MHRLVEKITNDGKKLWKISGFRRFLRSERTIRCARSAQPVDNNLRHAPDRRWQKTMLCY